MAATEPTPSTYRRHLPKQAHAACTRLAWSGAPLVGPRMRVPDARMLTAVAVPRRRDSTSPTMTTRRSPGTGAVAPAARYRHRVGVVACRGGPGARAQAPNKTPGGANLRTSCDSQRGPLRGRSSRTRERTGRAARRVELELERRAPLRQTFGVHCLHEAAGTVERVRGAQRSGRCAGQQAPMSARTDAKPARIQRG